MHQAARATADMFSIVKKLALRLTHGLKPGNAVFLVAYQHC